MWDVIKPYNGLLASRGRAWISRSADTTRRSSGQHHSARSSLAVPGEVERLGHVYAHQGSRPHSAGGGELAVLTVTAFLNGQGEQGNGFPPRLSSGAEHPYRRRLRSKQIAPTHLPHVQPSTHRLVGPQDVHRGNARFRKGDTQAVDPILGGNPFGIEMRAITQQPNVYRVRVIARSVLLPKTSSAGELGRHRHGGMVIG